MDLRRGTSDCAARTVDLGDELGLCVIGSLYIFSLGQCVALDKGIVIAHTACIRPPILL
jgi:hypothetical protein